MYQLNLTKKQAKKLKKGCQPGKVYAYMQDGSIVEAKPVQTTTQNLKEVNPYTFKITY